MDNSKLLWNKHEEKTRRLAPKFVSIICKIISWSNSIYLFFILIPFIKRTFQSFSHISLTSFPLLFIVIYVSTLINVADTIVCIVTSHNMLKGKDSARYFYTYFTVIEILSKIIYSYITIYTLNVPIQNIGITISVVLIIYRTLIVSFLFTHKANCFFDPNFIPEQDNDLRYD